MLGGGATVNEFGTLWYEEELVELCRCGVGGGEVNTD